MHRTRTSILAVAGGLIMSLAPAAQAQMQASALGVVEVDTKETLLLLGGFTLSGRGSGLVPLVGVQGYYLGYDAGTSRTTVLTVRPYAGLRKNFTGGSLAGTIGYAFSDRDGAFTVLNASQADQGEGVVVTAGLDHWGTGEAFGYQALGAYNFGSDALWTRGRITRRISQIAGRDARLGGEVAYLAGSGYNAIQPGIVLELLGSTGRILGLGTGMKFFDGGGSAVYFKVEGVVPLFR